MDMQEKHPLPVFGGEDPSLPWPDSSVKIPTLAPKPGPAPMQNYNQMTPPSGGNAPMQNGNQMTPPGGAKPPMQNGNQMTPPGGAKPPMQNGNQMTPPSGGKPPMQNGNQMTPPSGGNAPMQNGNQMTPPSGGNAPMQNTEMRPENEMNETPPPRGNQNAQMLNDSIDPRLLSLAMGFVPYQAWETPYDFDVALKRGTIFPSLDMPWLGEGAFPG